MLNGTVARYFSESKKNIRILMDAIYLAEHSEVTESDVLKLIAFHKCIISTLENTVPYQIYCRKNNNDNQ